MQTKNESMAENDMLEQSLSTVEVTKHLRFGYLLAVAKEGAGTVCLWGFEAGRFPKSSSGPPCTPSLLRIVINTIQILKRSRSMYKEVTHAG